MNAPLKKSWVSPKIEIRKSCLGGLGMFAIEPMSIGEDVLVWGGEYVSKEIADLVQKEGKLVMQWDDDLFSIEEKGDDEAYFLNHSCRPNVWMEDSYILATKRNIIIGEELTADYAMWEADESYISKWSCLCGALICRGKVTGRDWRLPALQKAYKNHFSPLINKRIAVHFTS